MALVLFFLLLGFFVEINQLHVFYLYFIAVSLFFKS